MNDTDNVSPLPTKAEEERARVTQEWVDAQLSRMPEFTHEQWRVFSQGPWAA